MKRGHLMLLACILVLSVALAGCGGKPSAGSEAEEPAEQEVMVEGDGSEVSASGWQALSEASPALTEEEQDIFSRAAAATDSVLPTPVAVLATQVVSGTNYAFLCHQDSGWSIFAVYQNLDGEARITSGQELRLDILRVATGAPIGALLGPWQVKDQAEIELLPSEVATAFAKVGDTYADATLDPIATLASKEDEGTDYLILCEGEAREGDAPRSLFAVVVHTEDGGSQQLLDVTQLEFLSFVNASA